MSQPRVPKCWPKGLYPMELILKSTSKNVVLSEWKSRHKWALDPKETLNKTLNETLKKP